MPHNPILLFLHGVGPAPDDDWKDELELALTQVGYPDLSGVDVLTPKYSYGLRGVDDDVPLPKVTLPTPNGDEAKRNRRDFERRRTAMEALLGTDYRGNGFPVVDHLVPMVKNMKRFNQADNYVNMPKVRAWVLNRIINQLPRSGRVVIVGHSLGSVIAADLIRRLPADLEVVGMVTIGSPLAHETFHVDGLRESLTEPPAKLGWWINFWSTADLVTTRRGVSTAFPWVLDQRIQTSLEPNKVRRAHNASTYLQNDVVATAIGTALFGSRSKEIAIIERGLDVPLDYAETFALLALRYSYLIMDGLKGDKQDRYRDAHRQVQASAVEQIKLRATNERRLMPTAIASLAVDLTDPSSNAPEPRSPSHLSIDDAIVPLTVIAAANVLTPFEIEVSKEAKRKAMEQLTLEMGLGRQIGSNVHDALDDARKELQGPTNWVKWTALGLGTAAVVAVTGGLALAAAPGLAGAAAVTSALAAFGPGGMIGGLLTAGTLASAGGGSIAIGLAAPTTAATTVEAVVVNQLATAMLRNRQGIHQDPQTWSSLAELETEVALGLERLKVLSDKSALTVKELQRKLDAIERALEYLQRENLEPENSKVTENKD